MKYVGMQTQIWRNNRNTVILLLLYPIIIFGMVCVFVGIAEFLGIFCHYYPDTQIDSSVTVQEACRESVGTFYVHWPVVKCFFLKILPFTIFIVAAWFAISYFFNVQIIRSITHARPLERKENVRVYNIVENLCIAGGIEMPQINIVDDPGLNAYTSGIDIKTFTITLTTGIIEKLDDDELSAVVAHELTHIKNRDTRLMVVCIVFVGLVSLLQRMFLQLIKVVVFGQPRHRKSGKKDSAGVAIFVFLFFALIGFIVSTVAYLFSYLNRLAISRKREYVADAGGAELCGNPLALASALRKISEEPGFLFVNRNDVAQLYIIHPDEEDDNGITRSLVKKIDSIFWTHPDTPERIQILEQF